MLFTRAVNRAGTFKTKAAEAASSGSHIFSAVYIIKDVLIKKSNQDKTDCYFLWGVQYSYFFIAFQSNVTFLKRVCFDDKYNLCIQWDERELSIIGCHNFPN